VAPAAGAKGVADVKYYRNKISRLETIPTEIVDKWRAPFGV
jgi:hypothetical protein